jgi:hypothetical protein
MRFEAPEVKRVSQYFIETIGGGDSKNCIKAVAGELVTAESAFKIIELVAV